MIGKGFIFRIITLVSASVLTFAVAHAQPKAIGTAFSFTGFGISYEHELKSSVLEIALKSEMSEMFLYKVERPGVSASVSWNFHVREWMSVNGNEICLFAGPGLAIGYACDLNRPYGILCGLKGRVGVECSFSRNIVISASVSPLIGAFLQYDSKYLTMKPYWNGLIYSLIPEIGIKYGF